MISSVKIGTLFCTLALTLPSCGPKVYFEETAEIEEATWDYEDQKNFTFEITDTAQAYDLILEIDHAPDFAFQNLYVKNQTIFPSGDTISGQTSLQLADKYGQWEGDCGRRRCTTPILLQENAFFKALGNHTIQLNQYSRLPALKGIQSLTMRLQASEM